MHWKVPVAGADRVRFEMQVLSPYLSRQVHQKHMFFFTIIVLRVRESLNTLKKRWPAESLKEFPN